MPKLPDRWLDYSNIGDVIPGTKFITFKVPLQKSFLCRIPEDNWFSPEILLQSLKEKGLNIGLIIDLTFTKKYYNPKEFTDQGVQYEKIFVPGHVIPSQDILDKFCETVDNFLENSSEDSLVGVHCTHGVNRTGYVVCRYMVDKLEMKATEALSVYGTSRGYPVERGNYIHDLKVRAGEASGEYQEPEKEKSDKEDNVPEENKKDDENSKESEYDRDRRSHHSRTSYQGQGDREHSRGHRSRFQGHTDQVQDHRGHHHRRENRDQNNDRGWQHRRGYHDDSYDQYSQNSYVQSGWSQPSAANRGATNSYNSGSYGPQRGFLGGWGQGVQYNSGSYTPYNRYQSKSVNGAYSYGQDGQHGDCDRNRYKDTNNSTYYDRKSSKHY
ncbi:RNA RNP complex-1-interacting phosphatase [Mactra antiquata]